jgi:hypothetical protein
MRDSNTSYWYKMRSIPNSGRMTHTAAALLAHVVLLGTSACATGQQTPNPMSVPAKQTAPNPMAVPAKQWATEAATNELKVLQPGSPYLRYRMHTRNAKGDQVRDMIQSKDGAVARLILKEGRPLTAEEDAAEHERLQAMLDSPSAYAKHVRGDVTDRKLAHDLIALLPEAMLYTYVPGQPQRPDRPMKPDDTPEIVIDYKPNPAWSPPEIEADGLTGLEGRVWIDVKTHHMTRAEGTIFRGVNMAGFIAHIYEGGKLSFEQTRVTDQRWIFSKFR